MRQTKANRDFVLASRLLKQTGQALLDVEYKLKQADEVLGRVGMRGRALALSKQAKNLAKLVADLLGRL